MESENCKITVVTVCLNSVGTIEKAIKSVINQSYKNMEYIIIDGGSMDGTVEIIKKYSPYIAHWISEPDKGIYQAMNKGIQLATGDLIGFLSSNDWYADGALQAIAGKFIETRADIVYGDAIVMDDGKAVFYDYSKARLEDSYYDMQIVHPAFFVKTDIQKKYGFDETYRIVADYKFYMQIYRDGYQFAHTKHNIIHFCLGGISSDIERLSVECRRASYEVVGQQREQYAEGIERVLFERLYYAPWVFEKNGFGREWIRKNIDADEDAYIFGAGYVGKWICRNLHSAGIKVIGFLDNSKGRQGSECSGLPIFAPEKLLQVGHGNVFVSSYDYAEEMEAQLLRMGIGERMRVIRTDALLTEMVNDYVAIIDEKEKAS